jgi:hypothetical protein
MNSLHFHKFKEFCGRIAHYPHVQTDSLLVLGYAVRPSDGAVNHLRRLVK